MTSEQPSTWLVVSFDLARHRRVLIYLGAAISLFGVVLFGVDRWEGMPSFWTLWEGPFVTVFGLALWILSRRVRPRVGRATYHDGPARPVEEHT